MNERPPLYFKQKEPKGEPKAPFSNLLNLTGASSLEELKEKLGQRGFLDDDIDKMEEVLEATNNLPGEDVKISAQYNFQKPEASNPTTTENLKKLRAVDKNAINYSPAYYRALVLTILNIKI